MKLVTKQQKIEQVYSKWAKQYKGTTDQTKINITKRLKRESPKTEDEITNIIGNDSWTSNRCDSCYKDYDVLVSVIETLEVRVKLCENCLTKALTILKK